MKPVRGKPDHEAVSVKIKANEITGPEKIYRNAKHNGNRSVATGEVEVTVNKQNRETKTDTDYRPKPGTVLSGGKKESVIIEAKRIEKHGRHEGKDVATASKDVRIFGKLQKTDGPEKKAAPKRGRSQ